MNIKTLLDLLKPVGQTTDRYTIGYNDAIISIIHSGEVVFPYGGPTAGNVYRKPEFTILNEASHHHNVNLNAFASDIHYQPVIELVLSKSNLQAVKEFKVLTGLGLKDAKDVIDLFALNLRKNGYEI